MSLIISSDMYDVVKQPIRDMSIKIELLNFSYQTIGEITGNTISGNISEDANADIRRTCSLSLVVTDSSFNIEPGSKFWLDRYMKIYVGINNIKTGEIVWMNQGIYLIDAPSWKYDATNNILTIAGLDLMAKLTGARGGYLPASGYKIPAGSNIKSVMTALLAQFTTFTNYAIVDNPQTVPLDMEFEQGVTVYEILAELRDLYPSWEIFFDIDGVFRYQEIPNGQNDEILSEDGTIIADDDLWNDIVIDEAVDVSFQDVKNVIYVYGSSRDPKYYGEATLGGNTYTVQISNVSSYTDGTIYGFTVTQLPTGDYFNFRVNSLGIGKVVLSDGSFAKIPENNEYYCVMYRRKTGDFLFLGHLQAKAIAKDENPDSPFYIGNPAGEIIAVKYGGDYDNIQSDELAQERANYELWLATRFNDNVTFSCAPVYWLKTNNLITFTDRTSNTTNQYIIKDISTDLSVGGKQTIKAIKYYPLYPDI